MQIKLTFWLQISFGRLLCQKCGGDLISENFNRKIVTMIAKDYFFCSMQPSNFSVKFTTESNLFISWGDLSQYNVFDLGFQCANLVFRWQIKDKQVRFHRIAFLNIKATLQTGIKKYQKGFALCRHFCPFEVLVHQGSWFLHLSLVLRMDLNFCASQNYRGSTFT